MTAKDASASALEAWAATRMAGAETSPDEAVGDVGRAPGRARYDPADVITVFMSARESAKQRNEQRNEQARVGGTTDDEATDQPS